MRGPQAESPASPELGSFIFFKLLSLSHYHPLPHTQPYAQLINILSLSFETKTCTLTTFSVPKQDNSNLLENLQKCRRHQTIRQKWWKTVLNLSPLVQCQHFLCLCADNSTHSCTNLLFLRPPLKIIIPQFFLWYLEIPGNSSSS